MNDSLQLGGAETLLFQYVKQIDRSIFELHLMTLRNRGPLINEVRQRAEHFVSVNRKCGFDILAIYKIRKYIISNSINIVHTNQWIDSLYVAIATIGIKIKKVSTVHGYDYTWRDRINYRVLKKFDKIICVSKSLRIDLYKKGYPWKKLSIIYNCFDEERFNGPQLFREYDKNKIFRLIMVGNFCWWKDQPTLIRAVKYLKELKYNIILELVGNGKPQYIKKCQSLISQLGLKGIVNIVENKRIDKKYFSTFDLFVFSSYADTFGIALLEAMASGLATLSSDIPASMELINYGKYGKYFITGNYISCAREIINIMENNRLRELIVQKAFFRSQEYRPENTIKELEKLYYKVLKQSK